MNRNPMSMHPSQGEAPPSPLTDAEGMRIIMAGVVLHAMISAGAAGDSDAIIECAFQLAEKFVAKVGPL